MEPVWVAGLHVSHATFCNEPPPFMVEDRMPPPSWQPCCHCGQLFGSASLRIHTERCRARRPHTAARTKSVSAGSAAVDERCSREHASSAMSSAFTASLDPTALLPCKKCGRTFFPERLAVHERVCTGPSFRRASAAPPRMSLWHRHWRRSHQELQSFLRASRAGKRSRPSSADQTHRLGHSPPQRAAALPRLDSCAWSHVLGAAPPRALPPPPRALPPRSAPSPELRPPAVSASRRPSPAARHAAEWARAQERPRAAERGTALTPCSPCTPERALLGRKEACLGSYFERQRAVDEPRRPCTASCIGYRLPLTGIARAGRSSMTM